MASSILDCLHLCVIPPSPRLIEIAESRFPGYFNSEEKLLLTSSKVHLYRELSCDEVMQRYAVSDFDVLAKKCFEDLFLFFMLPAPELKKKCSDILLLRK